MINIYEFKICNSEISQLVSQISNIRWFSNSILPIYLTAKLLIKRIDFMQRKV